MVRRLYPLSKQGDQKMKSEILRIPVGISTCLLGEKVRFDGGHMQSRICIDDLSEFFDWTTTCPEVAIGMPIPRPTIHLVKGENQPRLLDTKTHENDYTQAMNDFAHKRSDALDYLCGYVVAKGSPSCGMERIKVWLHNPEEKKKNGNWQVHNTEGVGLFTQKLMDKYPCLPIEENGRLNDLNLRDNFIARVFIYYKWKQLLEAELSYHNLFEFHARVKYALMAADVKKYKSLGRDLAQASEEKQDVEEFADKYIHELMASLKKITKRKAHHNVLLHIMGYFKQDLSAVEKQLLRESIDDYYQEKVPLGVPIAMLRHQLQRFPNDYLNQQFYLFPYPKALATREFL